MDQSLHQRSQNTRDIAGTSHPEVMSVKREKSIFTSGVSMKSNFFKCEITVYYFFIRLESHFSSKLSVNINIEDFRRHKLLQAGPQTGRGIIHHQGHVLPRN